MTSSCSRVENVSERPPGVDAIISENLSSGTGRTHRQTLEETSSEETSLNNL